MRKIGSTLAMITLILMGLYMMCSAIVVSGIIIHALFPIAPVWIGSIIGTVLMIFIEAVSFGIFVKEEE